MKLPIPESRDCLANIPFDQDLGRVEGSYYAPPLSLESGRTRFRVSSSRISSVFTTFAHVDIMVTASMDGKEILFIPVVVVTINMM